MASHDVEGQASRPPTLDDLLALCSRLNELGAKYLLIGGFALNYYGLSRATEDIDLLVDPSPENIHKIKEALSFLADNAAQDVAPDDVSRYQVVRVADEIIIDLMNRACDVRYDNAGITFVEFRGVRIPIADIPTLIRTKQGIRPRDIDDLAFLKMLTEEQES